MSNNSSICWNDSVKAIIRRRASGLTIIEVLVVMAIISIMSGIGLFYINSANFKLQAEARNIRAAFFYARQEAIKSNTSSTVKLFVDRYEDSRGSSIYFGSKGLILTTSSGDSLPNDGETITFYPSGMTETSNYHLKNISGSIIVIRMNNTGRIWLEKL